MAVLPIHLTTYGLTQLASGTFAPDRLVLGEGIPGAPHDQLTTALTDVIKTLISPGDVVQFTAQEVGDDVRLHVVSFDDSGDTYTLREFGLADATGLLAVYGEGTDIAVKGVAALHFEFDMTLANAEPGDVVIGPTAYLLPAATEGQTGVVQLATSGETATGAATDRAVSPARLKERTDLLAKLAGGNALSGNQTLATGAFQVTTGEFEYTAKRTKAILLNPMSALPMTAGWAFVPTLSGGMPTVGYWECSTDGALLAYPLDELRRAGFEVQEVKVNWENTGASGRVGNNRLKFGVRRSFQLIGTVGIGGAAGGAVGTPADADDGGAGSGTLTLTYSVAPDVSPTSTEAHYLVIKAGSPSSGGNKDRVWGVQVTVLDPGPRGL